LPLQNRVDPFGNIHAVPQRGTMMGNRGGRIHNPATKTLNRRYASRRWIACVCAFRGRQREVMGHSYTELFFLDEVTAFAAGHRPCAECRRADFNRFMDHWRDAFQISGKLGVDAADEVLHRERCVSGSKGEYTDAKTVMVFPDGVNICVDKSAYALRGAMALPWSFSGYGEPVPVSTLKDPLRLLTPPSIVKVFQSGYSPSWHSTAGA
jgi:hypothetical protein